MKKNRKYRRKKINFVIYPDKSKPIIRNNKKRKIFFITLIPLVFFISLIIVIPTIVVHTAQNNQSSETNIQDELPVFTEQHTEQPLIEVSIQRSETEAIETIPLEQYVASVVSSEMPATFHINALKAQAIAARTYIVNHLLHDGDELISDTTTHQVYRDKAELQRIWGSDFHWKWEKVNRAVKETQSLIITYENKPITPTFFSMSNGYTEDAEHYWGNELPYLKSVESKWEETLPNFKTQEIFTFAELNNLLNTQLKNGVAVPIKVKRTPSERVSEVEINEQTFTGRHIREKLDLRSTDFTIEQKSDHFIFTTRGYGHGVGMSQYGANGMAEEGKTYAEILSYYYQDIKISELEESAPDLLVAKK